MGNAHHGCDLLIVGGGPAGLAAAYRAAHSGVRVTVVDDNADPGGQIWRGEQKKPTSTDAVNWFEKVRRSEIQFINGASVFHRPGEKKLLSETIDGICELSYSSLILATGARERFLPFPGWTLPNVMGAGGLQALVKAGLPIEGKKVVVAGTGPLLMAVSAYLRARGAQILLIAEQAPFRNLAKFAWTLIRQPAKAGQAIKLKRELSGVHYLTGCWPVAALGEDRLLSVMLHQRSRSWEVPCDFLACGFHLVPNLELAALLGCKIENRVVRVDEFQQTTVPGIYCAGESTGIGGLELSLVEGEIAGLAAAGNREAAAGLFAARDKQKRFADSLNRAFELRDELKTLATPETIVCRCEDVTFDRLRGHTCWREAKLQTRVGMGPCQGRICGAAVEYLFGWQAESVRPPLLPVRVSSLMGQG